MLFPIYSFNFMALLSQIPRLGGLKGINNLNGLNGPLNLQWINVDEKSAQKNATRKFRKKATSKP